MPNIYDDVLIDLLKAKYDIKATTNEDYAKQLYAVHKEFVNRNTSLTRLLNDYIDQRKERIKTNNTYKKWLFRIFVGLFIVLTLSVIFIFIKTDFNNTNIDTVISLVSVAVTYLVSILSIVKIISQYLFPVNEEKDAIEMIKTVIGNDVDVEKMMSGAIDKMRKVDVQTLREYKKLEEDKIITKEEFDKLKKDILMN